MARSVCAFCWIRFGYYFIGDVYFIFGKDTRHFNLR